MRTLRRWLPVVLLIPFVALLWVPFYNRADPAVAGFPFFYAWLFAWIVITALLTWIVLRGWRA